MHCMYCAQALPAEAEFCFKCGKPVPDEARTAAAQPSPGQQAPAPEQAAPIPEQAVAAPVYEAVTTNAVEGENVMSFVTISNALNVVEGLADDAEQAKGLEVNPEVAESLRAKLQTAFDFLGDLHKVSDKVGQTMGMMKRASQALTGGASAGQIREDPNGWLCTQELTADEAALYNLAGEQANLREGLETRVLRRCESCRYERIFNPEYETMMTRQNQLDSLLMLPRNALMAVSRLRRSGPKFVCPRCQGMHASERTIVLCPNCGTPDMSPLLTDCAKCGYDFVGRTGGEKPETAAPDAKPEDAPKPSGKMITGKCADCGNKFRVPLDRVPAGGLKGKCSECGRPLVIRVSKTEK